LAHEFRLRLPKQHSKAKNQNHPKYIIILQQQLLNTNNIISKDKNKTYTNQIMNCVFYKSSPKIRRYAKPNLKQSFRQRPPRKNDNAHFAKSEQAVKELQPAPLASPAGLKSLTWNPHASKVALQSGHNHQEALRIGVPYLHANREKSGDTDNE